MKQGMQTAALSREEFDANDVDEEHQRDITFC
jgi:hypothetical protein